MDGGKQITKRKNKCIFGKFKEYMKEVGNFILDILSVF